MSDTPKYVLVTPTRDEEKTIGETIASVVGQTILPAEWVIVSDGSTDRTDEIVEEAQKHHSWIKLIKLPKRKERCFGAVTRATKIAIEQLSVQNYEFIGLLDSDLSFQNDYFEKVLEAFEAKSELGIAGGKVVDPGENRSKNPDNMEEVPGAVQFFRRSCFESLKEIYIIPEGGWDTLTTVEARINGFQTKLLPELVIDHLKPRNVGEGGMIKRRWQMGVREYVLGYHPLFQLIKCARRIRESPFFISAIARWAGYISAFILRRERRAPIELISQIRYEQIKRVSRTFNFSNVKKSNHKSI